MFTAACLSESLGVNQQLNYIIKKTLTPKLINCLKECMALEKSNKEYSSQLPYNFQYIKKLIIKDEQIPLFTEFSTTELNSLLRYLKNLKVLDLGYSKHYDDYMKMLCDLGNAACSPKLTSINFLNNVALLLLPQQCKSNLSHQKHPCTTRI